MKEKIAELETMKLQVEQMKQHNKASDDNAETLANDLIRAVNDSEAQQSVILLRLAESLEREYQVSNECIISDMHVGDF